MFPFSIKECFENILTLANGTWWWFHGFGDSVWELELSRSCFLQQQLNTFAASSASPRLRLPGCPLLRDGLREGLPALDLSAHEGLGCHQVASVWNSANHCGWIGLKLHIFSKEFKNQPGRVIKFSSACVSGGFSIICTSGFCCSLIYSGHLSFRFHVSMFLWGLYSSVLPMALVWSSVPPDFQAWAVGCVLQTTSHGGVWVTKALRCSWSAVHLQRVQTSYLPVQQCSWPLVVTKSQPKSSLTTGLYRFGVVTSVRVWVTFKGKLSIPYERLRHQRRQVFGWWHQYNLLSANFS